MTCCWLWFVEGVQRSIIYFLELDKCCIFFPRLDKYCMSSGGWGK